MFSFKDTDTIATFLPMTYSPGNWLILTPVSTALKLISSLPFSEAGSVSQIRQRLAGSGACFVTSFRPEF